MAKSYQTKYYNLDKDMSKRPSENPTEIVTDTSDDRANGIFESSWSSHRIDEGDTDDTFWETLE